MTRVITFGTFDLLHVGHVNLLFRASQLGDCLTVGVSSSKLNLEKKSRLPVFSTSDRLKIISSISFVSEVFEEESLDKKREYIQKYRADVLVMGSDWQGKFDYLSDVVRVEYLPRTEGISTSNLLSEIVKNHI